MSEDRVFPILSHILNHEPLNILSNMRNGSMACNIQTYMEIGVADGFTLNCRLNEHREYLEKIVLCDNWSDTDGGTGRGNHNHIVDLLGKHSFPLENVVFLDGDSTVEIPRYFSQEPGEVFDFIFVDGGKRMPVTSHDLGNTIQHARILGLHDIRNPSHLYLRHLLYAFYETVCKDYILIDDGEYLGMLIHRELWNWV